MNKLIIIGAIAGLLAGCAPSVSSTGPQFDFTDGARTFVLQVDKKVIPAQNDTFIYATPLSEIRVKVARQYFNVEILNKSNQDLQVVWDNSGILLPDGRTSRIAAEQRTYVAKAPPQAPTVIDPQARLVDNFFPLVNLGTRTYSGVYADPMFVYPIKATTTVRLLISLEVGGQSSKTEFVFTAQPN
jgi:hypothetical protein